MPEIRAIISIVLRISFVTLIAVLMILWIVIGVQTVNEIKQLESQKNQNNRNQNQNNIPYPDRQTLDRAKGMAIFNAIIDEAIGVLAIVGVVLNHRYLLQTSMILLSVIWLIAHSRMVEVVTFLYSHFTSTMIAAHVLLFFVVVIGLTFTYFVKESNNCRRDKTSKIRDNSNGTNGTNGTSKA